MIYNKNKETNEVQLLASSVTKHWQLSDRDHTNAHKISSITGLGKILRDIEKVLNSHHTNLQELLTKLENKLDKQIVSTPSDLIQVYAILNENEQGTLEVSVEPLADVLVRRDSSKQIYGVEPTDEAHVTNKKYVDTKLMEKVTVDMSTSTYPRAYIATTDGKVNTNTPIVPTEATPSSIVSRNSTGQIVAASPQTETHVTTKRYVDTKLSELGTQINNISNNITNNINNDIESIYQDLVAENYIDVTEENE